ncbi:LOW QUALITY PROTEIN: AN1-type zinc finger protein 4-like [Choristoneura fumiferana]|uniref:LOW QUALITY PROTEIN: AN1-type zinc finger protein 4-like n=1 Tax=Choristoneura fumiferana TaxID=7141 RepID=UPI003D156D44
MSQHGCPERLSNRSKGFQEESAGQATMEVLVETLTGTAFEMTVSPSDTIFAIKSKIFRVEGIPVSQQHLVYNLKELDDSATLRALGIADGARLRLVLGMRGGPISTRRLPPPPSDLGGELERLLNTSRYRESGCGGAAGCKVTVLVFRDGERVNMLRVRENRDGSLQPLAHRDYSSSLSPLGSPVPSTSAGAGAEAEAGAGAGARDNAVTMHKMLELRRRMEALAVQRHHPAETKAEIQKTRSEETLSVPSLLDDGGYAYTPYSEADDAFTPLYDGHYTRYDYECSFNDRYTLLPPIGSRTESEQSVDRLHGESGLVSEALSGLLARERDGDDAILEECLRAAAAAADDCLDDPPPPRPDLQPVPTDYGPVVGGGWRGRWGSSSALSPAPAPLGGAAHSASSLQLRRAAAPRPPRAAALYSASTSDLQTLTAAILPLSRHRNREHLHLSDEGLDVTHRKTLEAGSERRQRRIKKIAELENSRLFRFGDSFEDVKTEVEKEPEKKEAKKVARIRCEFCKKRLSIATVHKCRCGAEFCAPHRYAEVHGCAYDYKANAHQYLQRANPLVSAPKLPKI